MHVLLILQQFLNQSLVYVSTCWSLPFTATLCKPLWNWVAIGAMATGALVLLWATWKVIDYKLKYRAALRAEEYRQQIAPEEEMNKVKWVGDDNMEEVVTDAGPDLAAQIRNALDRRKLEERGMGPPELKI